MWQVVGVMDSSDRRPAEKSSFASPNADQPPHLPHAMPLAAHLPQRTTRRAQPRRPAFLGPMSGALTSLSSRRRRRPPPRGERWRIPHAGSVLPALALVHVPVFHPRKCADDVRRPELDRGSHVSMAVTAASFRLIQAATPQVERRWSRIARQRWSLYCRAASANATRTSSEGEHLCEPDRKY
jgi:hypothetical protein